TAHLSPPALIASLFPICHLQPLHCACADDRKEVAGIIKNGVWMTPNVSDQCLSLDAQS
ncbi:hypothetical protein BaRGS_00004641, partial [Batillaria attramentaria]